MIRGRDASSLLLDAFQKDLEVLLGVHVDAIGIAIVMNAAHVAGTWHEGVTVRLQKLSEGNDKVGIETAELFKIFEQIESDTAATSDVSQE